MHPINELMRSASQRGYDLSVIISIAHSPHIQEVYKLFTKRKYITAYDLVDIGIPQSTSHRILNKMNRLGLLELSGTKLYENKTGKHTRAWRLK